LKNKKKPVTLVLVGIGGMGSVYLQTLLENRDRGLFKIQGTVDPFPEGCPQLDELQTLRIPLYPDLENFFDRHEAELTIVSSPIQYHSPQTRLALQNASDVLCEKPLAATIQEARTIIEARDRAEKWVAVGYQWSFSPAIQALKKDILGGLFGKPKRLKCLYLWPRDEAYYRRNDWAGKQKDRAGRWILDSPANNAMAHDLHNMLYVMGATPETSAGPARVEAELYRAHDIQNFDTAAARCLTDTGVEILFYVSHASEKDKGPVLSYEFEKATVFVEGRNSDIQARLGDGSAKNYGSPDAEPMNKLWASLESVKSRKPPVCGPEAGQSQTLCLNGMQDSMPDIVNFPRDLIVADGEPGRRRIRVKSLDAVLEQCYENNSLPSELGIPWSGKGKIVDLTDYRNFPSDKLTL
jgi:predicted dehydrogenase